MTTVTQEANGPVKPKLAKSNTATVNKFRAKRGKVLRDLIVATAEHLGRDLNILDVGGRASYWDNVGYDRIASIKIQNITETQWQKGLENKDQSGIFSYEVGDARNLENYADRSVDFIHSNSVIEHVGLWRDMKAMAAEVRRVGRAGWMQAPAWEFPVEPHYRLIGAHWLPQPLRVQYLGLIGKHKGKSLDERRLHVDGVNLFRFREMAALFPNTEIFVERYYGWPKSFAARWTEASE